MGRAKNSSKFSRSSSKFATRGCMFGKRGLTYPAGSYVVGRRKAGLTMPGLLVANKDASRVTLDHERLSEGRLRSSLLVIAATLVPFCLEHRCQGPARLRVSNGGWKPCYWVSGSLDNALREWKPSPFAP